MKQPPKYKVFLSKHALQMLRRHMLFLARVSEDAAHKTRRNIMDSIRSLAQMPGRHSFFDEDVPPQNRYRGMVVARRYLVLYQIKDKTVSVDYIVDGREDYGWLFD